MRRCHDVIDSRWDFEYAAAVMNAKLLHGWRDGEADGFIRSRWVCNDQIGRERIESALNAFDRGVKTLQIYAKVVTHMLYP